MVMDFVEGVKVTNVAALDAAGAERDVLAEQYIRALCKQVLIDGFFHGDPHPGNLLVNPDTSELTMIDCGLIGQLTPEQRLNLLDFMYSLARKDVEGLSAAVLTFCKQTRRTNLEAYNVEVRRLIYRHVVYAPDAGSPNADLKPFLNAVTGSLYEYGLKMDSNFTLAIKAILQAEEAATTLSPKLDLLGVINAAALGMMREQLSPERIRATVEKEAVQAGKEILRRVPTLKAGAYKWLDNVAGGGVQVKLDTSDLSRQVSEIDTVLRRLVIGLVLGGLIIGMATFTVGTAQVASSASTAGDYTIPILAALAFGIVTVASLIVIWRVARPGNERE
jgi:ubiquinone biosynthesis protein